MFVTDSFRPTWVEIDLAAVRTNLKRIQQEIGEKRIIGVVKADAYGHGAVAVSRVLQRGDVTMLAVATLDEAVELRESGVEADILILGPVEEKGLSYLATYDLVATVVSLSHAKRLSQEATRLSRPLRVHAKIDTGMGRLGVWFDEAVEFVQAIEAMPGLRLEGVFSHFPSAGEEKEFSLEQIRRFRLVVAGMQKPLMYHIANSEAVWHLPASYEDPFTHVRPGISLYGVSSEKKNLLPVMSLYTRIVQVKCLPQGATVSYLRQYTVRRKREYLAVLPVGYADGIPTCGSGQYEVSIGGKRYPQVGRVCMDYTMVSLGDHPAGIREGDLVEIFGRTISLTEFASKSGRIPYEVMCGVSKRVPRLYKEEP